jgi:predicted ribosomally synthesized peptide with SipW-like signal peptide
MKKLLLSSMFVVLALLLMGAGTYALLSDTEVSTGNTFTSGTLNLQVGAADPCTDKVTLSGVKPTDTGNAATWLAKNLGSVAGNFGIATSAITNLENTITEPESAAGDVTTPAGELGGLLKIAMWMDADKSSGWTSGDYYLKTDGTKVSWQTGESVLPAAAYAAVDSYASKSWTGLQTVAASTDAGNFKVEYNFPDGGSGDNVAQGDSSALDITFSLTQ